MKARFLNGPLTGQRLEVGWPMPGALVCDYAQPHTTGSVTLPGIVIRYVYYLSDDGRYWGTVQVGTTTDAGGKP
jgi:hypothetical protein